MSKGDKILSKVMGGKSDNNLSFNDLCYLLDRIGLKKRVKGDHHIYYHEDIEEIINIQPKGSNAKPYQVKQVREIILKNKLEVNDA
jgi:predicted RNA binding protein YcfA (HicA-like mRNA interferase family)